MNFHKFQECLMEMGVEPGVQITLETYTEIVKEVKDTFGEEVSSFLMDCFMPEGHVIDPGFEDSYSHYLFDANDWEELEEQFQDSFS